MDFKKELENRVYAINQIISGFVPEKKKNFEKICDAVEYSLNAGGKRLRPMIMLESFRLCNRNDSISEEDVYPFMTAMEMIHTYSLVHDDLPAMDNDMLRRGLPTTHAKFGEDFGILAGDALLNRAYEVMLEKILASCEKRFADAGAVVARKAGIFGMVGGQCLDVELTGKEMSKDQLDVIFRNKTGALIEASFMTGGCIADAGEDVIKILEEAGTHLGLAFQIRDDILDCTGKEEEIGKPVGSDERNNKTTYVSLFGMDKANEDVNKHTRTALSLLESIGSNTFLFELIENMSSRNK